MTTISRRVFLRGSAIAGCSLAAHPLMTSVTLAEAPWQPRLVVLVLRGGMDGLDLLRPVGDRHLPALRPDWARQGTGPELDGYFTLHPRLAGLLPLWEAGELGFVTAVSTPYRDTRSHFEGQDMLEAGTGMDVPVASVRDGWLNRLIGHAPGVSARTAFALGWDNMQVLRGPAPVMRWSPDVRLEIEGDTASFLARIYAEDPLFHGAAEDALSLAGLSAADAETGAAEIADLAGFAAARLREETRIAAFSLNGWDTHRDQRARIARPLAELETALLTLRAGLGPIWQQTVVVAMTEFGRTARMNGSGGTDHGTGGTMLLAGGAVRGGRVFGTWPGLGEGALLDDRDLMPTGDVRAAAAWVMRGLYGLDRALLEQVLFPGLDLGRDPKLLL